MADDEAPAAATRHHQLYQRALRGPIRGESPETRRQNLHAKTAVPQMGYFAVCQDPENNTFALWK